jgi:spore coat polysaccharide biosynthesis predicted glycosyltransferase SpsG
VLNKEIETCKRQRQGLESILVTLGGSDTYGVTIQVVNFLKTMNRGATVVVGPAFQHHEQLKQAMNGNFCVKQAVTSLMQEFSHYDLAITGGGVTPFEANASGLPCIIIANERHEIEIGHYLAGVGSSVFAGYYQDIDARNFDMNLNIQEMSRIGMTAITTNGTINIFREIALL